MMHYIPMRFAIRRLAPVLGLCISVHTIFLFYHYAYGNRLLQPDGNYVIRVPEVRDFQCSSLLGETTSENVSSAQTFMKTNRRKGISDREYVAMAENCEVFRKSRGYVMNPVTWEELNYPIAYSIVVYKDVEQFERLLRAIYRPQNVYCIHVDVKAATGVFNTISDIIACLPGVFFSPERFNVVWGDISVMYPDMSCMTALLKHAVKWRYFINLTGQEFPLKTNLELVRILKALNGANDMEGTIKRRNTIRTMFSVKTNKRKDKPPFGLELYKGNLHMTASRGFVDFIINSPKSHAFYEWVSDTAYPEETFFATLQHNAHLGAPGAYTGSSPETDAKLKPFLSRYMIWNSFGPFKEECGGKYVRLVCIMGVGDLQRLVTGKQLFVNKLYLEYQYLTLDCLEHWLFERMKQDYDGSKTFDTKYYEELDFVQNCNCAR